MPSARAVRPSTIVLVLISKALAGPPYDYEFYRIQSVVLNKEVIVKDINDHGVVAGSGRFPGYTYNTGLIWENGVPLSVVDMCSQGELVMSGAANGVSNGGHFVGGGGAGEDACCTAVCYEGGSFAFPIIKGCDEFYFSEAMSDSGAFAAGHCYYDTSYPVIHFVADKTTINIGLLPGLDPDDAANAEAFDVNNDGLVVGTVYDLSNDGKARAFKWQGGVLIEIFDDLGGDALVARAVNNLGHIVGFAADEFGNDVAYIIRNEVMESLGYGEADGVNDRDVAVGNINTPDGVHAAVFDNGQIVDLDGYLPPAWGSTYATRINNYGWIIGISTPVLDTYGFLLVPIYDKGDYDGDGDVDLQDAGKFQECFAAEPYQGPEGGLHVGCSVFDFDDDAALDLTDYAAFQAAFTGPTAPDMNPYGPG